MIFFHRCDAVCSSGHIDELYGSKQGWHRTSHVSQQYRQGCNTMIQQGEYVAKACLRFWAFSTRLQNITWAFPGKMASPGNMAFLCTSSLFQFFIQDWNTGTIATKLMIQQRYKSYD